MKLYFDMRPRPPLPIGALESLRRFGTVAFAREHIRRTIRLDPAHPRIVDASAWVATVPDRWLGVVTHAAKHAFDVVDGCAATPLTMDRFADALSGACAVLAGELVRERETMRRERTAPTRCAACMGIPPSERPPRCATCMPDPGE